MVSLHVETGQSGSTIGHRQRRLMLQVVRRRDQAGSLLPTQDHRQLVRDMHRGHLGHQLALVERDLAEELQPSDRGIERYRRGALIDQVQLVAPQILDGGGVGRAPKIRGEPLYPALDRSVSGEDTGAAVGLVQSYAGTRPIAVLQVARPRPAKLPFIGEVPMDGEQARVLRRHLQMLANKETPRLCRGGSKSLTFEGVHQRNFQP